MFWQLMLFLTTCSNIWSRSRNPPDGARTSTEQHENFYHCLTMSNPTLFVCQSCNDAVHKRIKPSQGAQLLEQLNTLQSQESPITIQPVDRLWMCSKACVVAVSAANQPTYLFTNLPPPTALKPCSSLPNSTINTMATPFPIANFPKSSNQAASPKFHP